jgi:DNA-binding response OmpR family regulator
MPTYDLANVRLVLAEPNMAIRRDLVEALTSHGFESIMATGNMLPIRKAIEEGSVDLLVGDTALPEGDLSELVRAMRNGEIGDNPFLVTIILVSNPGQETMRKVINSGTDSVLVKPFTAEQLVERILMLIEKRKRFVVTSDYVGPDRRSTARPGSQIVPQIDVPNPLQCRAMGQGDPFRMKRVVENAAARINEQKVERDAFQIGYLVDRIVPGLAPGGNYEEAVIHLKLLASVSRDIARRIKATKFLPAAAMCLTLVDIVLRMIEDLPQPDEDDLRFLSTLPPLICRIVLPDGVPRAPGATDVECQEEAPKAAAS